MSDRRLPVVVLISGRGSNLKALIDAIPRDGIPADIYCVISNRADAAGLKLARQAGIPTQVVNHHDYDGREDFDRALMQAIDAHQPGLVLLAGFMRILTPGFVHHYRGRLINIHPSLLPAYTGLNTHQRVIEAGDPEHGASVHFVTEELDGGPVFLQARVPVLPDDDAGTLAARVLREEHRIYPLAVDWFARGRLRLAAGHAELDGQPASL